MKFILTFYAIFFALNGIAQKQGKLIVKWHSINIIEDFNYSNRMEIYIDGINVATSTTTKQSVKNCVQIPISKSLHAVRIVNYVDYKGRWEEYSLRNGYSLDAIYEFEAVFDTKKVINITFDIINEIIVVD